MKNNQITETGKIDSNGNLNIFMGQLNEFFKLHKNSKVIARFTACGNDTSEALRGYYFSYVIPTMKNALHESGDRKTEKDTELFVRELSPIMQEEYVNDCKYHSNLRSISDLSNAELIEHIEFIKQLAAEEYSVFIEDPNTFNKTK